MTLAAHPHAPTKVFREPAATSAVQCPACGGPITLRGFGGIEQVACPYCGSELAPEASGALSVMRQVQRQHRNSVLPLGIRGTIDGIEWELIGIVWRECSVDGAVYPWQEFLLYNPYRGYRWLVYQLSDGHWQIGEALAGAPKAGTAGFGHKSVEFKKERYRHFQTVVARATYVEGEFPWQVHAGDQAVVHDYVLPPSGLSIEESSTPDGGADVAFTAMRHIEGADVWKAFGRPGRPPGTSGVGAIAPNPHKKHHAFYWSVFGILLLAWLGVTFLYASGRDRKTVFQSSELSATTPIAQEITIGEAGKTTTLELTASAPLSNQYAYVEVMLIKQDAEEAIGFGLTAEEWHGVEGGESWREGDSSPSVTIGGVEGGKYLLQVTTEIGDASGKPMAVPTKVTVKLEEDVVLVRYIFLPLIVILAFPIFNLLRSGFFEGRRWNQSDYAGSSE
jgi:DNA-directed RNA polymerase subunit RPC12/RpoP